MVEQNWKKIIDKKYDVFNKRYSEAYPETYQLAQKIGREIEQMFEKLSPFYGEERPGTFKINVAGEITSHEPFILMLGAIGKVMKKEQDSKLNEIMNELQKIQRYLKYAIPELEKLIECPSCKEYNPPDKKYCVHCQKQIIKEELNGKKE